MLETKIDTLTDAIKELTASLKAGGTIGATATTKAATTKALAGTPPQIAVKAIPPKTIDEVRAAVFSVRDHPHGGKVVASKLIKDATGAETLAKVAVEQHDTLHEAALAKVAELDAASADESGGL